MRILSGIDIHFAPNCGSILLAQDIYSYSMQDDEIRFLILDPLGDLTLPPNWSGLPIQKDLSAQDRNRYQSTLDTLVDRHIEDFDPELLHCQHLCYGMTNAFVRYRSIPKLGVCHGTDVIEAHRDEGFRSDFCRNISMLDRIIFPSRGILANARSVTKIPDDKLTVIPWGLPARYLVSNRITAQFADQPFNVLFAGRFDESKGIDVLLQAFILTPANLRLTLIGAGPLTENIIAWLNASGLNGRVTIRPWMERDALQDEFAKHQLLVLPSREIEAFGLVCAEAQATALPVLVSHVSGLPEILPEGCEELSFESGDINGLSAKMSALALDRSLWRHLSRLCRKNAKRFPLLECVNRLKMESSRLVDGRNEPAI